MTFRVEITDPAGDDIADAITFISRDSVEAAAKWFAGLQTLIFSLKESPGRFAVVPEAIELQTPYRSALYHSHRIVFRIDDANRIVYVVRLYHGARQSLTNDDVSLG
ncbi:MAG: plasmid stabilization system protein [Capsulimonas sp.]|nr:plasmid stabilization system protein [Capsulimonas sp.]